SPDTEQYTADAIENADLASLTLNLEGLENQPYGAVRDRIMASGWIPHTFADTTGPESDFQDGRVKEMESLGFMEVKSCSGTGQGFCRFEFVYEDRIADNAPILVVTTTAASPGDANYPMPNVWSFRQENISDLTYSDRSFDASLFTQLREQESFCLGIGQCEQSQYLLKDALLISATGGFGTTTMTLIPKTSVSKDEAIAYARILDDESVIDFNDAQIDNQLNVENYYEAGIPPETVADRGGITAVRLQLTPDGQVSEVSFSVIVL
ncbi:MAG: hypothetical protein F6K65_39620, partial [Moorea sp. SIO3C2]|nr:hypothetical protein [Moorena sp. SIO3C2]